MPTSIQPPPVSLPHSQAPGLLGHLLQGNTTAQSKVTEVQKGHAQALVLKVADLLLTRQLPQRCHIIHKLMLALGVGKSDRKGGLKTCSLLSFWPLWEGKEGLPIFLKRLNIQHACLL